MPDINSDITTDTVFSPTERERRATARKLRSHMGNSPREHDCNPTPQRPDANIFGTQPTETLRKEATLETTGIAEESRRQLEFKISIFQEVSNALNLIAKHHMDDGGLDVIRDCANHFRAFWTNELTGKHNNSHPPAIRKPLYSEITGKPTKNNLFTSQWNIPNPDSDPFSPAGASQQQQQRGKNFIEKAKPPHQQSNHQPAQPRPDLRLFIRLDDNSPAWSKQPLAIRHKLAQLTNQKVEDITQATLVKTGWAIRPANQEARNTILQHAATIESYMGATKVEPNQKWITCVVTGVPSQTTDFDGEPIPCAELLQTEVKIQAGMSPVRIAESKHNDPNSKTKTLLVSFLEAPKRRFTIFGSAISRVIRKTESIPQCDNCWDFHPRYYCNRTAKCKNCSKNTHNGPCSHEEQCVNCLGPHPADDPRCPGRPSRKDGRIIRFTRAQRNQIRKEGSRLFKRHHPTPAQVSSPAPDPAAIRSSPCPQGTIQPSQVPTLQMEDIEQGNLPTVHTSTTGKRRRGEPTTQEPTNE